MRWQVQKAVLPIILLTVAIAVFFVLWSTRSTVEPTDRSEQPWLVSSKEVRLANVQPRLRLYGEIVAGREVDLRALVPGEVVAVADSFVEGGKVVQGNMIIQIDDFEYRANFDELSAQINEARARLQEIKTRKTTFDLALKRDWEMVDLLQRDVKRVQALSGKGTVSEKRLDAARMELTQQQKTAEMRQSDLAAETAQIKQQEAVIKRLSVGLRRAKRDLQRVRLTAPFDGFLADVQAQVGKRLGANDSVAKLIDPGRLEARFTLTDHQYGRLLSEGALAGRPAKITWQVGRRSFQFNGRLDRIGARVDSSSGGVQVFARLDGTDLTKPLRPGAFVTITVPDRTYRAVARMPESALYNGDTVYVIKDERLVKRDVELVARIDNDVLLRGGLKMGDWVVITKFAEIGPGQKVEVR